MGKARLEQAPTDGELDTPKTHDSTALISAFFLEAASLAMLYSISNISTQELADMLRITEAGAWWDPTVPAARTMFSLLEFFHQELGVPPTLLIGIFVASFLAFVGAYVLWEEYGQRRAGNNSSTGKNKVS